MKRLLTFCVSIFLSSSLAAAATDAFGHGETFKFRVAWGPFGNAGEIHVAASISGEAAGNASQLRVSTTTRTKGLVRALYPFDGEGECLFDARDGRLLTARASALAGKKKTQSTAVFDYAAAKVRYEDRIRPQRNVELPLPAGKPVDLLTCLVQTRAWDLKPGERRPVTVMFDDDFYELTVIAQRYERVKTPRGEVDTLVLAPVRETNPKGMFRRGGTVRVWISQDEKRLPVKFEVALKVGAGTAYLIDYRSPQPVNLSHAHPRP
jgi:hypothetical protein